MSIFSSDLRPDSSLQTAAPTLPRRNVLAAAVLCLACLVGLICLFIGSQALVLKTTSDARIIKNLKKSTDMGVLSIVTQVSPYGHFGHYYDTGTECYALSVNLGNQQEPLLTRLATTPNVVAGLNGIVSPCMVLIEGVQHGGKLVTTPYIRYWWGAGVYLRPLLNSVTLEKVHIWTAIFLIAAAGFLALRINRNFGFFAVLAFLLPLAWASNILTTPAVTVHALTWIWAFVSLGVMMRWLEKHEAHEPATIALVFSLGCIANFFDVLFSPPYAPTFIAFVTIAFGLGRLPLRTLLRDACVLAACWFAGFCLTWISKWLLAVTVAPWSDVVADVGFRVRSRGFHDPSFANFVHGLFEPTRLAIEFANLAVIGIAWGIAIAILAVTIWQRRLDFRLFGSFLALLVPLLIPIGWVEVLHDHTLQHPAFAARAFIFFATIPLMAALILYRRTHVRGGDSVKQAQNRRVEIV